MNSKAINLPLVVEFIGVTGVGKSTLIAAASRLLSARGLRVCAAEDAILACHGLSLETYPKMRSALSFFLGLPSFGRFCVTREGRRLVRLALGSIGRGMSSTWRGASLLRNFMKRVGSHLLLESLRDRIHDCDVVIWDEGIVHGAHNLFVHTSTEPRRDDIEAFGRLVPKPDLLIWIMAPTAQSAEVVLRRGHSRVCASQGCQAAWAFAEHAQTTFEVLCRVPGLRERIYQVENSLESTGDNESLIQARASVVAEFLIQQIHKHKAALPEHSRPTLPLSLVSTGAYSEEITANPAPSVPRLSALAGRPA